VSRRCACGAALTRPESIDTGRCLEDRLTDWRQFCRLCARPSLAPFCDRCLALIVEDSRTGEVECWVEVPGFDGYRVSSFGRVKSLDRIVVQRSHGGIQRRRFSGQILKPHSASHRGLWVHVGQRNGQRNRQRVHRLVLEGFVGRCPAGMECCHWDDDFTNNRLHNLRWDTPSANRHDQVRNGRHAMANKTHCVHGHEFTPENTGIQHNGGRYCLTCAREQGRERMRRRRRRERQRNA
jgi:hypothetical protein